MKKFIFFLFFVLVVLSACTFSFGDDDEDDALGTLSLKIQSLVSPSSSGSSDRAIIKADDVRLTLINPDGSEQGLETTTNKTKSQYKAKVKAGTGYKVRAEIINAANGPSPVVSGTSDVFAVESGKNTNVSVLCIPISPEVVNCGDTFELNLQVGKEYWYCFKAESDETMISFTKQVLSSADSGKITLAVYDKNGSATYKVSKSETKTIAKISCSASAKPLRKTLNVSTEIFDLYYIGLIKQNGDSQKITISIGEESSEQNEEDNTGEVSTKAGEGTISVKVQ